MGLDATVFCDCFEKGRLQSLPHLSWDVSVAEDGSRVQSGGQKCDVDFDQWDLTACEHKRAVLVHHYIGNIALVMFLRETLSTQCEKFPLILSKIIHNGVHCGDFLNVDQFPALKDELTALSDLHCQVQDDESYLRSFEAQLRDLLDAAIRVNKPISF